MCGIVVIIRKGIHKLMPELQKVLERISHRGSDDSGIWATKAHHNGEHYTIGMGHVRLSILDLSPKNHQPYNI